MATPTATAARTPTAAVGPQPKRGGSITIRLLRDVTTYDPHIAISGFENELNAMFYNGLLWNPKWMDVEADAAESWKWSGDGKTLTFVLRPGIKYADGRAMTTEDVVWSVQKQMGKIDGFAASARTAWMDQYVTSITAPDARTVVFNLSRPAPVLEPLFTTGFASIIPKGSTAEEMKARPVGSGPFILKSHTGGSTYVLERNPTYFKSGLPYLDGYQAQIIVEQSAIEAAVLTGRIDGVRSTAAWSAGGQRSLEALAKEAKAEQHVFVSGCRPVGLNINSTRAPWTDVRVRKAAFLALDRQEYITVAQEGFGQETLWLDTGGWGRTLEEIRQMPGFRQPKTADIAEAKRLLAEAGFPDGFEEPNMIVRNTGTTSIRQSELIQAQLGKVGIRAKLVVLQDPLAFDRGQALDYGLWNYSYCQQTIDPDELFSAYFLTGGSRNWMGYGSKELDGAFTAMSSEVDPARRKSLARDMEDILLRDIPHAPTSEAFNSWTLRNVGGYPVEGYRSWYTDERKELWYRK